VARRPAAFTLVEVLVALAIVSIALLAALRAAGQGSGSLETLRARLLAGWVAENLLAEHRARGDWLPPGMRRGRVQQGGIAFAWREEISTTPHAAFRRIDLFVSTARDESHTVAHLTGFLAQPVQASR